MGFGRSKKPSKGGRGRERSSRGGRSREGGRSSGGNGYGGRSRDSGFSGRSRDSGGRFSRDDRGSGRGRGRRSDFKDKIEVVCDSCGKTCLVPFKPTEGKPVYCDDCFKDNKPSAGGSADYSKELAEINDKLDRILKVLDETA